MTQLRIGLVACCKPKLPHAAPARDLYQSQLFKVARVFVERNYDEWWILSALHGLVHPDTVLEPYDLELSAMSSMERLKWGNRVLIQVGQELTRIGCYRPALYLHAGALYRDSVWWETASWTEVYAPLKGLQIGQQLHWYKVNETLPQPALL